MKVSRLFHRWISRVSVFVDRFWYVPLLAVLAGSDAFIWVFPTDAFLFATVLLRPRLWLRTWLWLTTGSSLGAFALACAVRWHGHWALDSARWAHTAELIHRHGALAVAAVALGPFPLQPGVAVAAMGGMRPELIFVSVWVGRAIKYFAFSWLSAHAPHYLYCWGLIHRPPPPADPAVSITPHRLPGLPVD